MRGSTAASSRGVPREPHPSAERGAAPPARRGAAAVAFVAVAAAGIAVAPATALAHVRLVSPVSRYGDEMKFGPCGRLAGTRSANVTTLAPGATVTVVYDEVIDHPGWFRIAFDPAGEAALAPPTYDGAGWHDPAGVQILANDLPNPAGLTHGEVSVTLPNVECAGCTLQLIQVMTDKPPFDGGDDFYYQCADLVLTAGAPPPPPPPPPPPAAGTPSHGCSTTGGAGALALVGAWCAAALARRRVRQAIAAGR